MDFALIGHPADYVHFAALAGRDAPDGEARFNRYRETLSRFVDWTPSYVSRQRPRLPLPSGRVLEGCLIICPFLPERLDSPQALKRAHEKVIQAAQLAGELGVKAVGLGGFTSILEGLHGNPLAQREGMAVTSGNALTAALAVAQTSEMLDRLGRRVEDEILAVVGATGDIGLICCRQLGVRARKLILIARNKGRLALLRETLGDLERIEIATDLAAVGRAGVVILAAGATQTVASEDMLAPGAVACDVGFPKNLSYSVHPRADVLVFSGGLAELPAEVDLQVYTGLPTARLMYGCFTEAMVLAARADRSNLSTAQGGLTPERVRLVLDAATCLGVAPASPYRGAERIGEAELQRFRCVARAYS
jgi:predicted amino acid dehydrogenase